MIFRGAYVPYAREKITERAPSFNKTIFISSRVLPRSLPNKLLHFIGESTHILIRHKLRLHFMITRFLECVFFKLYHSLKPSFLSRRVIFSLRCGTNLAFPISSNRLLWGSRESDDRMAARLLKFFSSIPLQLRHRPFFFSTSMRFFQSLHILPPVSDIRRKVP